MKTSLNNSDIFRMMEEWAPKSLAYDWDRVGIQVGSFNAKVKKIMVTLDVLESVVDEAIAEGVDLIIAHHPLLFKPIKQLNFDDPKGRVIKKLMQHNITVYAAHTNLDAAEGGVNDMLSDALGLKHREVLIKERNEELFKLISYVPFSHKDEVHNAFSLAGAGHIGDYSHCTFQTEGKGTFKPLEGSNPYIGNQNEIEFVNEVKMETIVQKSKLSKAVNCLLQAHPYEEPAYDIIPLANKGKSIGIGRVGEIDSILLSDLCDKIKTTFGLPVIRVTGELSQTVNRVAVLGGSGENYISVAKQHAADVYITGDVTFHNAQDAWQMGLSVIDAGHYIEKIMKEATKKYLDQQLSDTSISVMVSEVNTDPFQFV
ncbi:Nif3-like dinuclear metal center hexameric protein [Virgibacillus halodenitrificans]|uniref:Nif3-like dinuclear metal center hexameric protein n=1 Tax=Virgibacillus halodenitrificans TaxID=1482 RepID=UPI0013711906|nr:Nif3-like dinuclear metal center hexameric protein [Virgibacillus halodenitrificans]MYL46600.1 Nif3-like dinuclear metal center hexameric protein [Virgibacillus halodenitrificans]